jgi:hypothetical protein
LKIFGKVRKFWAVQSAALNFHIILKICFWNKWFLLIQLKLAPNPSNKQTNNIIWA